MGCGEVPTQCPPPSIGAHQAWLAAVGRETPPGLSSPPEPLPQLSLGVGGEGPLLPQPPTPPTAGLACQAWHRQQAPWRADDEGMKTSVHDSIKSLAPETETIAGTARKGDRRAARGEAGSVPLTWQPRRAARPRL